MEPAATETVAGALPVLMLQTMFGEVADVTGLLFTGWRMAFVLVVLPVISVCQMSARNIRKWVHGCRLHDKALTMGRRLLSEESREGEGCCELHGGERCALSVAMILVVSFIAISESWRS